VWLVVAYKSAPYVATWGIPEWWKPIAIILMLPAFLLSVIGLTTPDPTSVGQEGRAARSPEGIVGLDRPEGMLDLAAVLRADNGVDVSEGKIAPHVNTLAINRRRLARRGCPCAWRLSSSRRRIGPC
jgi:hypothetical protein